MKKLFATAIISTLLIVPTFAAAQTTTTTDNSAVIAVLEQLVITLTKELEQLIANRAAGTTASQTPAASAAPSSNYSSYTPVTFSQFQNNPAGYTGQNIEVEGMENTFLPSTGSGNSNFIEVTNLFDTSQPKLMFEVDSQSNYTAVVNALQSKYYPLIRVYGTGMPDQNFSLTSAFQTTTVSLPVVSVSRVDWCPNATQSYSYNGSSLEDDESCPSWTTTAPSSAAGTVYSTPVAASAQNATTQQTSTPNSKPSNSGQCNFNGDVFSCESNPAISISPTSLPSATVGVAYGEALTLTDPDTTSQTIRWNIISGQIPPGIGLAFSPNYALECSGTYCYFTSPPSGVSATSPGSFFGTPTTAGTYTFTLQAIDSQDYIALPTFTITVANPTETQTSSTAPAPTCTLTTSPSSIQSGQQSKLSWTSSDATSGSLSNIGSLSSLNSAMWVAPGMTTAYTATFKGSGGSTNCVATVTFIPPTQTNGKYNQTINFGVSNNDVLQNVTFGIVGFSIDAQASSGLGVSFTAQGDCTVTSDIGTASVGITGVGSCTVTAHQAGNANYNAAPDVSQSFTIYPNVLVSNIIMHDVDNGTLTVGNTDQFSATVSPTAATNNTVSWSSSNSSVATINPNTGFVTGVAAGQTTITAVANDSSGVTSTEMLTVTSSSTGH
jgi:hypothetical protein